MSRSLTFQYRGWLFGLGTSIGAYATSLTKTLLQKKDLLRIVVGPSFRSPDQPSVLQIWALTLMKCILQIYIFNETNTDNRRRCKFEPYTDEVHLQIYNVFNETNTDNRVGAANLSLTLISAAAASIYISLIRPTRTTVGVANLSLTRMWSASANGDRPTRKEVCMLSDCGVVSSSFSWSNNGKSKFRR